MIVSINQPAYIPWLGYYHRIAVSDLHIVLDHVQFEKNSFINRNKIRIKEGWCWLTVPVNTKGKFGDLAINRIEISSQVQWREKHWATLRMNYSRAPYFHQYAGFFEQVYRNEWQRLSDLLSEVNGYLMDVLQIKTPIQYSSKVDVSGQKDELVLNLCRAVNATQYLSGPFGRDYLKPELFEWQGIALDYHDYAHPVYQQAYAGFEPYMSVLDLLFNCGTESYQVLMHAKESKVSL